ncbi:MAG: hypothetical protein M3036_04595, partial [Bifidobacteriales bacterium]|nr:hypothetical protein [Bifidobacteriales bacterium]
NKSHTRNISQCPNARVLCHGNQIRHVTAFYKSQREFDIVKECSYRLAARAIDVLRKTALTYKQSKTELTSALHIARPTLNARFEAGDMMLSKFIQLSKAVGVDPCEALNDCDGESPASSALAEEEE